ncbi:MAG: hypothetical protein C5B49_12095 [Bdellovibrio sp.]|nr:MAG: hypothetical protein C5B49_12095 [Bdellovibrio sp.]
MRNRPHHRTVLADFQHTALQELFGYERGAFTGAIQSKRGLFELAHQGTIFLDEVAELSLAAQAKVLRVLQSGEIQKVGSEKHLQVSIRVITATHKDLKAAVAQGTFRQDLYYRINVFPIHMPALRERPEDIPQFCQHFLKSICEKNGFRKRELDPSVLQHLQAYSWPGNIRELQNVIERMAIVSEDLIRLSCLPDEIYDPRLAPPSHPGARLSLRQARDQAERQYILENLRLAKGNITQAAKSLDIERTYLHRRMGQLGIQKKDYFV